MTARKHIINPKTINSLTKWEKGNVPKKHAPFFGKPLPLNEIWQWRAADLNGTDGTAYRLLVMYRFDDKFNYKAWLSIKTQDNKHALVCKYEAHSNHGGRHCHLLCNQPHYPVGEISPANSNSFPHYKNSKQSTLSLMGFNEAWNFALNFYRIGAGEMGSLL